MLYSLKMSSSSSDSDSSEKVKNIDSLLIKSNQDQQEFDEGCAYKRKLGDLIFNANFEGGNLGHVERIDEYSYDLMVRPDITNPRHRMWFNFTVSNQRLNQCVIFTLVDLSENVSLFHIGLTPVVRCQRNPIWTRLHEDQVFYYKSPHHGYRFVLTIAFRFDGSPGNQHQFALFYPYTITTLTSFISRWKVELSRVDRSKSYESKKDFDNLNHSAQINHQSVDPRSVSSLDNRKKRSLWQSERPADFQVVTLELSILLKPIYMLRINDRIPIENRPEVFITCRPCGNLDSYVSFVCQGLIDFLLSSDPVAQVARIQIDFCIFPMIDPDSASVGNSRTELMGQSKINQKIIDADRNIYANFKSIQSIISESIVQSDSRTILIELAGNLNLIGSRIRGHHYQDTLRMEQHLCLPRLLSRFARDFYLENCEFPRYNIESIYISNEVIADRRTHLLDHYKLEIGPYGWFKRSLVESNFEEYNQTAYLSLGKALVCSLVELLRANDIQLPISASQYLNSFLPKSDDIDDLVLNHK